MTQIENNCVLTVADDGPGNGDIDPGNGLKGMAERVNSNGGKLSWEQNSHGFNLTVQLPMASI